jgi:hypothetical protein
MANMLIGVYDGLYAAGAELGLARYYCLTPVLTAAWKRIG